MSAPSLRHALLVRCGLAVGVLLCLLSAGVYQLVRAGLFHEIDRSLFQTTALLSHQVELENGRIEHEWREGLGADGAQTSDGLFQFWSLSTGATTRSPALGTRDLPQFSGTDGAPFLKDIRLPDGRHGRAIGLHMFPFVLPEEIERMMERGNVIDSKSMPHLLVVARNTEAVHRTLDRLGWTLAGGTLLALALVFLVIRRVVAVTLRPIDELALEIQNRASHRLDSALVLPGKLPAELVSLAQNFDSLLGRVSALRQRERDFIRHAAHELRTPIAALRATTDLALSQPREAPAYAAQLAACQKSAIELGELVQRLTALARIGQSAAAECLTLDAAAIFRECLKPFLPRFREAGLSTEISLPPQPISVRADAPLLRVIFTNLLDNSLAYATPGTPVRISADATGAFRIANRAASLPEDFERMFEPLFRQDPSLHPGAHLGIGLTLCLEAATAIGAALDARETGAGWVEFVLELRPAETE